MSARACVCCLFMLGLPFAAATQQAGKDKPPQKLATPYFPLAVGQQWVYQVGDHHVTVTVSRMETVEIKLQKPDGDKKLKEVTVKVQAFRLESKSDDRMESETVAVLEDGVYRLSAAGKEIVPPLCFLKLPVKAGETWQVKSMTGDMPIHGTFTAQEEDIEVPALKGKTKALKAYSDDFQMGKNKMKLAYWFVPKVGLAQQHVHVGSFEVLMKLEKMTANVP